MGASSASLFTSRGTPASSDSSGSSGSEDDYSTPQEIGEKSRYCPCCSRIFAKDFYLFGHLKRSKKCKILCGERGCERPIEGMREMLMCYNSRHRFHCQKCERRFKSWRGFHKHLFGSGDCIKPRKYNFRGRGAAKLHVNHYKPRIELGLASRGIADAPTPGIYRTSGRQTVNTTIVKASLKTPSLEKTDAGEETTFSGSEKYKNYGKLGACWDTWCIRLTWVDCSCPSCRGPPSWISRL